MDETESKAIIDELIAKAKSALEEIALRVSDALEHLKSRELLAALGALSGCEENLRNAAFVIRFTHENQQKLAQALHLLKNEQPNAKPGSGS